MPPPPRPAPPPPAPLVGRDHELGRIDALLRADGDGSARVTVVSGEAGIGKTALLGEVARRATDLGYRVLGGSAVEFEADIPFTVMADAFGSDVAVPPLHDVASPLPVERFRAYRAVGQALERFARGRAVLVALDDLHWADRASVELVGHLLRHRPRGPVLLALAMRPTQAPVALTAAVQRALREGRCEELALRPLGSADCDRLLGPGVPVPRRRALEAMSGGNPFFLIQLARAAGGQPPSGGAQDGEDDVPPAVRAAVAEELRGLSAQDLRVLEGAAVAGDPFSPGLAAAAAEVPAADADRALDVLARAGLVRGDRAAARMRFRHPIVRQAVAAATPPAWRIAAHARVAGALAAHGGPVQARAHHLERSAAAGDMEAVDVIETAGREAASGAPGAAARWFEAACRLLPGHPDQVPRRIGLMVMAAASRAETGDLARCAELLSGAIELTPADAVNERVRLVTACAGVERLLGRHRAQEARLVGVLPDADEANTAAAVALRVELVAGAMFRSGPFDLARARTWGRRALTDAEATATPALIAGASAAMGLLECAAGRLDAATARRDGAATALDGLDEAGDAGVLDALFSLGWIDYYLGRFDDALHHIGRGVRASRASGRGHLLMPMRLTEAAVLHVTGRLAEAGAVCEEAIEAGRVSGNPNLLSWALSKWCLVATSMGDPDAACRAGAEALEVGRRHDAGTLTAGVAWSFAGALIDDGQAERAGALILDLAGGPELTRVFPSVRPLCFELLTRAELTGGRTDAAGAWAAAAGRAAEPLGGGRPAALAARARALVALASGHPQQALDAATASATEAAAIGARIDAARAGLLAGRALGALGQRERAVECLIAAEAELGACGASRHRDEAARELRRLGRRVPRARAHNGAGADPAPLSPRESQIAELVSRGRRNREIAEQLFLSERTVEDNVARIRAKLGVASRAAIGAAVERTRRGADA